MNEAMKMVEQLVAAIGQLAVSHGDKAIQLTLESARIMAVQELLPGFCALLTLLLLLPIPIYFFPKWMKYEKRHSYDDRGMGYCMIACLASASMTICLLVALTHFANAAAWAGIFRPELYIATNVVKKVIK